MIHQSFKQKFEIIHWNCLKNILDVPKTYIYDDII